jgi:hypothetical protein
MSLDFRTGEWRQAMEDLRPGVAQGTETTNAPRQQQSESLCFIILNNV